MSAAGQRLENLLFKQMAFRLKDNRAEFKTIELPELLALVEENNAIAKQFFDELPPAEYELAIKIWEGGRNTLLWSFLEGHLQPDVYREIKQAYHQDMMDFIMYIDRPKS